MKHLLLDTGLEPVDTKINEAWILYLSLLLLVKTVASHFSGKENDQKMQENYSGQRGWQIQDLNAGLAFTQALFHYIITICQYLIKHYK